jgi:hypothetical protein
MKFIAHRQKILKFKCHKESNVEVKHNKWKTFHCLINNYNQDKSEREIRHNNINIKKKNLYNSKD